MRNYGAYLTNLQTKEKRKEKNQNYNKNSWLKICLKLVFKCNWKNFKRLIIQKNYKK